MKSAKLNQELSLYAMLVLPVVIVFVYNYLPLIGIGMAFQDFTMTRKGFVYSLFHSSFVGLDVFKKLFRAPDMLEAIRNTIIISSMKIIAKIVFPLLFALLLNEVTKSWLKKLVTTVTYLPFFLSWVVLGGILLDFFSPQDGAFNKLLVSIGGQSIYVFGNDKIFPIAVVISDLWKEVGYNTIIFLAALTSIDVNLYEAAVMDGAGRLAQTRHITIPSMMPIVVLVIILSLGNILNAGQDQILNLYSPAVYSTGEILDTYTFRLGIMEGQFSIATAAGLFKSIVSFVFISGSYLIANRFSNYRVF